MTSKELTVLADRLVALNAWRRGTDKPGYDPEPFQVGLDIDAAVHVIRAYANFDAPDHLYQSECHGPGGLRDNRDTECPACRRMGPP